MDQAARAALSEFVSKRLMEGSGPYQRAFNKARPRVEALFKATDDLRNLSPAVVLKMPGLIETARFLGGPPLSQDDLDTLSGGKVSNRRSVTPALAKRAVKAIEAFLDPFRCPWVLAGSRPDPALVRSAIDWTTSLWAVEMCRTARRGQESAAQEKAVAEMLRACGVKEVTGLRRIQSLDDLDRGCFTREVILAGAKADLAVRLRDGRLLAIECKVSNSAINSVKRLNRETVGKGERWRTHYGQQVVTAAVLSGVFKVSDLIDAQTAGVFIVWQQDLTLLKRFVGSGLRK
ncbi:MAG: XamI family restriction endonuclease [Planctomycetota bacterium]|nr:XamI family restriction endonuclease [Planctomycetota bacterium]